MALLALFQPDPYARARLADALGEDHELLLPSTWGELDRAAALRRPRGCVVDPYNSFDPVPLPEIEDFRHRFPELALIVYGEFSGRELDLYRLGRLGADGVLLAERDDSARRLREGVESALSACLGRQVSRALQNAVPPVGVRCIRWAVEHAEADPQVSDLARAVRSSPRTLSRTLRARGLPPPRHLLLWGRLLQGARLLESSGATVEEVAFRLGYATGASLGRAFREQVGCAPSELGDGRGVNRVLEAFLDSVEEGHEDVSDGPSRWSTQEVRRTMLRSFLTG